MGLVALSSGVLAGGFALFEQSVKGLGNAFAGSAAVAEDAATLFFNPAGLTITRNNGDSQTS
ncbi:MAG: outer membrane protein transport protein [Gammaproteobacteria bacterium]